MGGQSLENIVVFLGPTLSGAEASKTLSATFVPPAKKGDIYRLISKPIDTIILIDGYFHSSPSVWHREILNALDDGIRVIGASSMGALRAAELSLYGMEGVGTVYEWYRDGCIDGDDEVALWHGPPEIGYCKMSEPLVNIRSTLLKAVAEGIVSEGDAQEMISYGKRIYYPNRNYDQLLECPLIYKWADEKIRGFQLFLREKSVDIKKIDAVKALSRCAEYNRAEKKCLYGAQEIKRSPLWEMPRIYSIDFRVSERHVIGSALLEAISNNGELLTNLWIELSTRAFIMDWARFHRTLPGDSQADPRLVVPKEVSWLRANGLSSCEYYRLSSEWAVAQKIVEDYNRKVRNSTSRPLPPVEQQILDEWAKDHNVVCPQSFEREALAFCSDWNEVISPVAVWLIKQGPAYFGLQWTFEVEAFKEIQRTGHAAQLLSTGRAQ